MTATLITFRRTRTPFRRRTPTMQPSGLNSGTPERTHRQLDIPHLPTCPFGQAEAAQHTADLDRYRTEQAPFDRPATPIEEHLLFVLDHTNTPNGHTVHVAFPEPLNRQRTWNPR
jgi:hypothetical protein